MFRSQSVQKKSSFGFTLIELLVVIAIIAILAAILFPVFAQAREKARQSSCSSNMKQLALAVIQYNQDYDEVYPSGVDDDCAYSNCSNNPPSHWTRKVLPYIQTNGLFSCPDDTLGNTPDNHAPNNGYKGVYCSYAANGYANYDAPSYALHFDGVMGVASPTTLNWYCGGPAHQYRALAQIGRPSDTILFYEEFASDETKEYPASGSNDYRNNYTNFGFGSTTTNITWFEAGTRIPDGCLDGSNLYPGYFGQDTFNGAVTPHHSGGKMANFAFCDGHVKAETPIQSDPCQTYVAGPQSAAWNPSANQWNALRQ